MTAAGAGGRSELATRAVAGAVMVAVAVAALWLGGAPFWLLVTVAAMLMLWEWGGLMHAARWKQAVALLGLFALLLLAGSRLGTTAGQAPASLIGMIEIAGLAAIAIAIATLSARMGAGLLYVAVPVVCLLWIRMQPDGLLLTLWTLAMVWATDIGAYFAGRSIGGPKLAPAISPSKTWAGLGGGMVAAAAAGALIASAGGLPRALLWLGAVMAVLAQAGDLFESWLKRRAGVKDSGRLLPGHGGVLDRLDGVVPVAAVVAMLAAGGVL